MRLLKLIQISLLTLLCLSVGHADTDEEFRAKYYDEESGTWNFPPPKSRDQKTQKIEADALRILELYAEGSEELDEEAMDRMTRNLREANKINRRVPGPGERVIQPDIAAVMEPLRDMIYGMAQSETYLENYHGVRYLTYLAPTDESMNLLYAIGQSESSEASVALDAIFQSGWDTPELRMSLVEQLEQKVKGESKKAGFALSRGGSWGLTEAVPAYTELLEQNYYEHGHLSPISQLIKLRESAASALPTIYKILEDGRERGTLGVRELHYLKNAITALGGIWPEDRTEPEPPVEEVAEVIEEVISPEPAIEGPAEVVVAEPVEEGVEPSSNWLLWLIGAVVVVGGVVLLRPRK